MDCERGDEHGSRSPAGSKSSFPEDDTQIHLSPNDSSDKKDWESTRSCLKESELSPTVELSGKENSRLNSPLCKSTPLPFDVHIKEVPADEKTLFQDVLNPPDMSSAFPVCVQLPAKHLQKAHISPYETSHRHHRTSRSSSSSTSSKSLSLKAPVEDLCASFLLACLFCKFWDCLLAVGDGCQYCLGSVCSSFCSTACCCCCEPSSLELMLDFCPCCGCGCAEYVEACGCSWGESAFDCSACDLCLQTTECLELGMELSQLLFH